MLIQNLKTVEPLKLYAIIILIIINFKIMIKTNVLIIGGGIAGVSAGLTIKKKSPSEKILIVKDEKGIIVRCSEPYALGGKVKLNKIIHSDNEMLKNNRIDFLIDQVIDFLDFPKKKIAITKKGKKIKFNKLILATGAKPFIPPIPGIEKQKNIFVIRQANDIKKIKKTLKNGSQVVVIGGGAIGIETASLLKQAKAKVTILEIANQLMPGAYDADYAQKVKSTLEKNKIKIKLGIKINKIEEKQIITSVGKIKYDLIICSCGVRANTKLAQSLNCRLGKFGVEINQFGQTSVSNIWAAGDCAQAKDLLTGKAIPSQLATTAVIMGKLVGANLSGQKMKFKGALNPAVSCFFNFGIGRVGLTENSAKTDGIKIKVVKSQSLDQYPSQPTSQTIEVKLIFNQNNQQLIGAQIFGGKKSLGMRINLLSLAIAHHLTANDLSQLNYCAHPETTPLPFMEPVVIASEKVIL